ncbi:hypothetical protein M9458_037892, partial [Cirrhinus mrigala]
GHHVLVRTDNRAVVSYINHQGGLCSCPLYRLAHQILLWAQRKLLSLRALHIPGHLSHGADVLLRQEPRPGEWRLHPQVVELIYHPAPQGLDAMVETWPRLRQYARSLFHFLVQQPPARPSPLPS